MEIRHFPAAGQSLIGGGHSTHGNTCECQPVQTIIYKRNALGRMGRHQGRTIIRIEYRHNFIEPKAVEPSPEEPGLVLFGDDRIMAQREDMRFARAAALENVA